MPHNFFDYEDGDYCSPISDTMAMDSDGNLMMRMADNLAMDMEDGELHFISGWHSRNDENDEDDGW